MLRLNLIKLYLKISNNINYILYYTWTESFNIALRNNDDIHYCYYTHYYESYNEK